MNAPGAWSDDVNSAGPVAAVGLAERVIPVGIRDTREELSHFATSALDGRSSWVDLPGFDLESSPLVAGVALSPDGRWLGWVRTTKGERIKGWSVKDTVTGTVRTLEVEGHDRVRPAMSELAFSGDSRHLLTGFEIPGQTKGEGASHRFVAWSVDDGTPTVLEDTADHSFPNLGHAAAGVVWSRGRELFRHDPQTGRRSKVTLPRDVLMASWAPGDAAFAYIGMDDRKKGAPAQERLYVGTSPASARRVVDLPETSPLGEALSWRDSTHVVVGNYRRDMYVVDLADGSWETIDMAGSGEQVNTPLLATGLWAEPLRPPAAPSGTSDPRRPWRWAGLVLFVALLGGGALLLRRADRTAEGGPPRTPIDRTRQS